MPPPPPQFTWLKNPSRRKLLNKNIEAVGCFLFFCFLQEHGVAEEVTHMLVRGKQKIPTMVDVSHLFLFFSTLDSS